MGVCWVRMYRTQIRTIQLAVLLTLIVLVFGVVQVWGGVEGQPAGGNPAQNPGGAGGNPAGTPGGDQTPVEPPVVNTKIVCLGDSFTYGYPGEMKDSWPQRLGTVLKVEVVNSGKVYQNASDLLQRFDQDVLAKEPGRLIIFAGVGDAIRGITLEEYQKNVQAIVEKAEANHIKPIFALPVPYPGTDKLHKEYREWQTAYAKEKNIMVLDFKEVLFDSDGKIIKEYTADGKYPNKNGYLAMGDYAARVLQ